MSSMRKTYISSFIVDVVSQYMNPKWRYNSVRIIAFLKAGVCNELGRALMRTFVARGVAALGTLALALVVGQLYGPEGMGVYAIAYSLLLGIGILCRQGMDNGLMRYVGRDHTSSYVRSYLYWVLRRSLFLSSLAALLLFLGRFWLEDLFRAKGLSTMLVGIALAAPAYTWGFMFSGFFKGVRKPATASLLENGSVALGAGLIIFSYNRLTGEAGLPIVGYAYTIAAWLVALQGGLQAWLWCRRQARLTSFDCSMDRTGADAVSSSQFMATSRSFFITGFAGFMQSVVGVMVAGWLLKSAELGLFKSSQQTAVLIGFILIVINAIIPPRFATLYYNGQFQALAALARKGALLGLVFAAPLLLLFLIMPAWILGWFGEDFRQGANLLRILALAQLINVATGSVGFLLNMTGHERLMRNIALVCNALGLLGFFLLPQVFGVLGAALALSFVLVTQNLTATLFAWRRLGIWILPGPNVFRWLGLRGGDR